MPSLLMQITVTMMFLLALHTTSGLPKEKPCSPEASDLVFALDSSFSIHPIDFKQQLNFLNAMVDQLPLNPSQYQVGVLAFATDVKLEIKLDQFQDKYNLRQAIGEIEHLADGSNTWKALHCARTKMFTPEFGARPSARKQLVIISDGRSANVSATMSEAAITRAEGIEIFSIAVATGPQEDAEIQAMASEPKSGHVFKVGDFKALTAIASSVSGAACNGFYGDQASSGQRESIKDKPLELRKKKTVLPACKGEAVEVLILLDSSTSMWQTDFKSMVAFTREVMESFDIANNKTRMGVVAYSDRPVTLVSLGDDQSPDSLHRVLDKAPYVTGATDTAFVIKHARTEGFSQARPYVGRIIVLVTDGESRNHRVTLREAKAAQRSGIGFFIVGVGRARKENLRAFLTNPKKSGYIFHKEDTHKRFSTSMLLAERICKEAVVLAGQRPPERCPRGPTDVIFTYDTLALSRHHDNLVIRAISSITASNHINSHTALRVGVVRSRSEEDRLVHTPNIELTDNWTGKQEFRHRLDPRSKSKTTAISDLLAKVRYDHFPGNLWSLPVEQRRRRLIVLFLDSPIAHKYSVYREAKSLKSSSDVEIAVVVLGKSFSERQANKIASSPEKTYVIRGNKGHRRLKRIEQNILNILCR